MGATQADGLDPVRIQKGMFLLSKRGPARDVYSFRPYNWGPFSADIYRDLDALEAEGLLQGEQVPGRTWRLFTTTPQGEDRARQVAQTLNPEHLQWLSRTRQFVGTRSFTKLLREIYSAYPEYAGKSLLQ